MKVLAPKIVPFLALAFLLMLASAPANETSARVTPVVKVVTECADSVVNISTQSLILLKEDAFWGPFHARFADTDTSLPVGALTLKSVGSGVVISSDGLILTNAHVVQRAGKIFVTYGKQKQAEAKVLSINQGLDLALLKLDVPELLKPVKFAKDVMIGETVVAIGNPLGFENSVSVGVVSGTHREIPDMPAGSPYKDLVQIDAPVNHGNSGGGLFNLDGEFIGITLAVVLNAQGIGFVIPFSKIQEALEAYRNPPPAPAPAKKIKVN